MKKVALGLSGGVDSSVAGLLLKKQGYEVVGVFLECFRNEGCRADEDRQDALKVAGQLDIPFLSLDFRDAYRQRVLNYFYETYRVGLTPNPDMLCNSEIKFGLFMEWTKEHGFDYLATGHYAAIKEGKLMTAADMTKDQSYFLARIGKENLGKVLFPLGDLEKTRVREIAREHNLATAEKKDSTGVCFVGEINVREFLKEKLGEKKGKVVDRQGKIVGEHDGVWFYTIGQRRGLKLNSSSSEQEALYVVEKDVEKNELVVGEKGETRAKKIEVGDLRLFLPLISSRQGKSRPSLYLRIRHLGEFYRVGVEEIGGKLQVIALDKDFEGAAEGQFGVFYSEKDESGRRICLGSGVIEKRCV